MTSTKNAIAAWRELQGSYLSTASALERALQDGFGLGLSDFETLALVAEASGEECTMRDLVAVSPMTQSALSRVVDRLTKAGLVQRTECSFDRRSLFVDITPKGLEVHAGAHEAYAAVLLGEREPASGR